MGRLASPEDAINAWHASRPVSTPAPMPSVKKLPTAADRPPLPWRPTAEAEPIWSSERPKMFHSDPDDWRRRERDRAADFYRNDEDYGRAHRFRFLSDELRQLDELSGRVSSRRAQRQEGVSDPGRRARDLSRNEHRTSPLYAPQAEYDRRVDALARQKRIEKDRHWESIPPVESAEVRNAWEEEREAIEERFKRDEDALESVPFLADRTRDLQQLTSYDTAREEARTRGRYPAQKPFEPHREERRTHGRLREAMLDEGFVNEEAFQEKIAAQRIEKAWRNGDIPGLIVPAPKREPPIRFDPSDFEDEP